MVCDGSGCPAPSWDDFKIHVIICTASWIGLLFVGLMLTAFRHMWDVERVSDALQDLAVSIKELKYYLSVMAVVSILISIFYILWSEQDTVYSWGTLLETIHAYYLCLEILILFVHSCAQGQEEFLEVVFKRFLPDVFLCVSTLIRGKVADSFFSFSFVAVFRGNCMWGCYEDTIHPLQKTFKVRLFNDTSKILSRIFCAAALIRQLERFTGAAPIKQHWKPWEEADSPADVWTFSASIYTVFCTVSTVGYGDVQPKSIIGQCLMMFIIVGGIGLDIFTGMGLVETFQHATKGGGQYNIHSARRSRRHIVVCGSPAARMLQELLDEIYHEDHMLQAENLDTVVMLLPGNHNIMDTVRRWLHDNGNSRILNRVWLLEGSPVNNKDLQRIKMADASLGYVLPNMHAKDAEREDIENAMRALSMHRYAPYVRLIVLAMKDEFRNLMLSTGLTHKDVICLDEIKLGLMGKACGAPGFATLVANLFKSSGEYVENEEDDTWMPDYRRGLSNEIYEARLSPCYRGAPFGEISMDILKRSEGKAYMIGVVDESRYPGVEPVIRIHPGRHYRVGQDEECVIKGIFVATDRESIEQHPADKPFSWSISGSGAVPVPGAVALPGTAPTLPGAVPEAAHAGDVPEMAQRWILDPRVVKRDADDDCRKRMGKAASTRAVAGLKDRAHLPRAEVSEVLELPVADDVWNGGGDYADLEDEAEYEPDPRKRALLQQQLAARKAQELDKQKSVSEHRELNEKKIRVEVQKIAAAAIAEMAKFDTPRNQAKADDELLWGGPKTPRLPFFGNPQEPPVSVLLRGDHIILLALEGHEDESDEIQEGAETEKTGCKLGVEYFVRSIRAEVPLWSQRAIVVITQTVPFDWPVCQKTFKDVYLIVARPLAPESLWRAGVSNCKAIAIYQRGVVRTADPTLVDAGAIFATALSESLLDKEGKEIVVLVDLQLDENSSFVAHEKRPEPRGHLDEMDMKQSIQHLNTPLAPHFSISMRYASGQLFASSVAINCLLANMLYNPALGAMVGEMLASRFVVICVPTVFKPGFGDCVSTFEDMFKYIMREKNLVAVGLLRKRDIETMEDEEEMEVKKEVFLRPPTPPKRYESSDNPSERFVYTMPPGERKIHITDGIMCLVPKGDRCIYFLE